MMWASRSPVSEMQSERRSLGRLSRPGLRLGDMMEDVFGHGPGLGTVLDYVEVRRSSTSPLESQSSVDLGSLPLPTSTFREARVSGSSTGREFGGER